MFARRVHPSAACVLATLLVPLAGCAPGSSLPPLPRPSNTAYRLGVGDQLRVLTYNELQLSNTFIVGDNGQIAFPLIGTIPAMGLTTSQLETDIASRLASKGILNHPSISVEVTQYRPIFVLGEVSHPGQYPYMPGMTTLSAVALAGGYTYRAVTGYAGAVRNNGTNETVEGRLARDSLLQPGDVITIYERYF
ncbi:polysaccharide export protein [Gluconacetobacter tumulicola]|uniref:Polysaccharide export protein n=2 Tax=Gluconacetobacter tumulicola TaxID=1017177 RepID=A0A7W4P8D4_9PROT|nr:polysaccharide export protein [Gluconacetobacter tumulicola]